MENELYRLSTFLGWPEHSVVRPTQLSRLGFIYSPTNRDDEVKCYRCGIRLSAWKENEDPLERHRQRSPNCVLTSGNGDQNRPLRSPFLTSGSEDFSGARHDVRNVPAASSFTNGNSGGYGERSGRTQAAYFGSQGNPKFPEYSDIGRRLQTLRRRVSPDQAAERLSSAGFFYDEPRDEVRCFQCGGILCDWEPGVDPWEEHRKWYPDCTYLKSHRQVVAGQQNRQVVPEQRRQHSTPMTSVPAMTGTYQVDPREVKARMDTPTVRAILDLGYSRVLVRAAIEKKLRMTGDDFKNAESLLEAVFQLEDAGLSSGPTPYSSRAGVATGGTSPASSSSGVGQHSSLVFSSASGMSAVEKGSNLSTKSKGAATGVDVVEASVENFGAAASVDPGNGATNVFQESTPHDLVLVHNRVVGRSLYEDSFSGAVTGVDVGEASDGNFGGGAAAANVVPGNGTTNIRQECTPHDLVSVHNRVVGRSLYEDLFSESRGAAAALRGQSNHERDAEFVTCGICRHFRKRVIFDPCGHSTCFTCFRNILIVQGNICPFCRSEIRDTVIFRLACDPLIVMDVTCDHWNWFDDDDDDA